MRIDFTSKVSCCLNRVTKLIWSLPTDPRTINHECGVRYKATELIMEKIPYEYLYVKLSGTPNPRTLKVKKLYK